ncbi:MAG: hypothetical protein ABR535_09735 [Pyrinomonadaceae bacterium]
MIALVVAGPVAGDALSDAALQHVPNTISALENGLGIVGRA